ncbi:hypothetical protein SRB5_45460 [Streptomyces sp. RB5]|uniref:Lipoprotein n=1 Tax=Streptomyces smaragdinus TaxID=2585196 RepID=A0A7K0CLM4_9ACTN|nr:hypothetical protein [Streptomyces smaragdinus]MQY14380.1 hypothetical protein [Streptomyces smaragdinus]
MRRKRGGRLGTRVRVVLLGAVLVLVAFSCSAVTGEAECLGGVGLCDPGELTRSPVASPSPSGSPSLPASPLRPGERRGSKRVPSAPADPADRPSVCPTPAACDFPDASNTGPRTALKQQRTGDATIRENGAVIKGWDITGSLDIYANDVTVIDSRITSTNWWGINLRPGYKGLRILHTEITAVAGKGPDNGGVDYAVSNMGGSSIEVGWCDVSVFGDALSMGQGNLHDNYVHDIVPFVNLGGEWQHTNTVISGGSGAGKLTIRHNTLLNPTPIDKGASASVGLFADTGPVSNTTVHDNYIAGGAYALYAGGEGSSGIEVTDNVFATTYHPKGGYYGVVAYWNPSGPGNVWRGNRMSDGKPAKPQPPS